MFVFGEGEGIMGPFGSTEMLVIEKNCLLFPVYHYIGGY